MAYFDERKGKWLARVKLGSLEVHYSSHDTEEEADMAEFMAKEAAAVNQTPMYSKAWFEMKSKDQVKYLTSKHMKVAG